MTWAKYDLTATVKRGWNAPSVIMWSLGNEVQEGATGVLTQAYENVQANLIDWTTALDTTRPATRGDNVLKGNKIGIPKNMMDAMTTANGTVGLNYCSGNDYDTLHNSNPNWKLYGSETASAVNSRGVYDRIDGSKTGQKLTSYDNSAVNWGQLPAVPGTRLLREILWQANMYGPVLIILESRHHGTELEKEHKEHGRLQRIHILELLTLQDFQKIVTTSIRASGMTK